MTFKNLLLTPVYLLIGFGIFVYVGVRLEGEPENTWGDEPYFCVREADNAEILRRGGESGILRVKTTPEYCSYLQSKNPEWKLTR